MSTSIAQYKKSLSWPQFLHVLVKHMAKNNLPETFLTTEELACLNQALSSAAQWESFCNGETTSTTTTDQPFTTTAFRVRAMLTEHLIPLFFDHNDHPCCQSSLTAMSPLLSDPCTSPIPQTTAKKASSNHVPLLDIYHTLELDSLAMMEHRKLKEEDNTHASLFVGTDQFNLQFLLKGITENRDKMTLSDRELRHLLSEVNPHKSKWANEERVGQEELYEACEKVLIDLKNYTEHSAPFLTKVSKRDAPDYYEVIKEPMDLGTMAKKLKQAQYNSKQDFARDLYLIYDNCLEYNTDSTSEYRKHAAAMRRKTDRLLNRVPDIQVKETDADESDDDSTRSATYDSIHDEAAALLLPPLLPPPPSSTRHHSGKVPLQSPSTETEHQEVTGDLQNQLWRDITNKTRATLVMDMEKQDRLGFSDRHAMTHHSLAMTRLYFMEHLHHQPKTINKLIRYNQTAFAKWLERTDLKRLASCKDVDLDSDDEDDLNNDFFFSRKQKPTDEDDALRNDLFLPEYSMTPNIPIIQGVPESLYEEEEEEEDSSSTVYKSEQPSLDIYPSTRPLPYGLNMYIDRNIKTLDSIRSTYKKCNRIRHNLPVSLPSPQDTSEPQSSPNKDKGTPTPTTNTPQVTKEAADQMMQRAIIQLLTHAGFESAHAQPVNILNEIVSELFLNMGKTLRRYIDEYSHKMTSEEILLHTLQENGVTDLENYVTKDIQAYGDQLVDLNQELEDTFHHLIKESDTSDQLDDEESFMIANFGEEFFGLKELGVDKEHDNLKMPLQLWYAHDETKKRQQHLFAYPPRFQPIVHGQSFIGLLQPWYNNRLKDKEGMIEDEFRHHTKTRPPYPPSSHHTKLIKPSRIALKDGSNTLPKRKKVVLDESRAMEKKRQRLAQKKSKKTTTTTTIE